MFRSLALLLSSAALLLCAGSSPPNVLFIIVDDLRAQAGAFGQTTITPNIDRLAARGVTFTRAYVQISLCSPSRTSILTGRRPDSTRLWTIGPYFRNTTSAASSITTLPQLLRASMTTTGAGKVWHPGTSSGGDASWGDGGVGGDDLPWSWSMQAPPGVDPRVVFWECDAWVNSTGQSAASAGVPGGEGCVTSPECIACLIAHNGTDAHAVTVTPCPDECFVDSMVATRVSSVLSSAAASGESIAFFAGFKRPHLGFQVPQHAFDLYPANVSIAESRDPPAGMPPAGWWENGETHGQADVRAFVLPNATFPGMLNDSIHAYLRRGYYASVSWMDSQLGRVLDTLDATGLSNSTWVTFIGDHGWSLGEHGEWAKQQLFENALRVPLIIAPPRGAAGWRTNATVGPDEAFVEAIDLFPTIAELLGVQPPDGLEGRSMVPLLRSSSAVLAPLKSNFTVAAPLKSNFSCSFSQIVRADRPCTSPSEELTPPPAPWDTDPPRRAPVGATSECLMGLSVRTLGWRYTTWLNFSYAEGSVGPRWDEVSGEELYDHTASDSVSGGVDPGLDYDDASESVNVAAIPAFAAQKSAMLQLLKAGYNANERH